LGHHQFVLARPPTLSMGFVSVFFPLLKKKGGKKKGCGISIVSSSSPRKN
jgi:hypothetical protein